MHRGEEKVRVFEAGKPVISQRSCLMKSAKVLRAWTSFFFLVSRASLMICRKIDYEGGEHFSFVLHWKLTLCLAARCNSGWITIFKIFSPIYQLLINCEIVINRPRIFVLIFEKFSDLKMHEIYAHRVVLSLQRINQPHFFLFKFHSLGHACKNTKMDKNSYSNDQVSRSECRLRFPKRNDAIFNF